MKTIKKLSLFLTLLSSGSMLFGNPQISPALQAPLAQATESNACEQLLQQLLKIVEVVDFSLEHMAQVVNNNQVRGLSKKEVLPKILELRKFVAQLKKHSIIIEKDSLAILVQVSNGLLDHIRDTINSGLQSFPPFDPTLYINRSKHTDLPAIAKSIEKQSLKVQQLEREAQSVGLNILNKTFRKLEHLNRDYKILKRAGITTMLGGLGILALYAIDPEWLLASTELKDSVPMDELSNISGTLPRAALRTKGDIVWVNNQTNPILKPIAALKEKLGTVLDDYQTTPQKGLLSSLQRSSRGLVCFSTVAPFVIYEGVKNIFGPILKDQVRWAKNIKSQTASYLRGGQIKKTTSRWQKEPKITFDDVIGNEHAKDVLMPLVHYLLDHEKYDRSGIVPGTGVLLMGDPRTGKTYMAEALGGTILQMCRDAGLPEKIKFYSFTAADLKEWGIVDMLKAAQLEAPVIIFIDELDTGGFQREADSRSLCQLMTAMSELNCDKSKKVVLIGATNKPQNLDYALLQPGRFGTKIQFHYPTEADRKRFIKRELENRAITIPQEYIEKLAHQTKNCPFDEIFDILTKALQQVKMRGTTLNEQDLERAYDQVVHKIIHANDIKIPEDEEQLVSIHRAGQSLARVLLDTQEKLIKVTSLPVYRNINEESVIHKYLKNQNGVKEKESVQADSVFKDQKEDSVQFGKLITASPTDSLKYITADEMKKELQVLLAGFAAERLVNGSTAYIYNAEAKEHALNIAKFICYQGLNSSTMPKAMREEKLQEAHALLAEMDNAATTLLKENESALLALANALHEERILTVEEIREIISTPQE